LESSTSKAKVAGGSCSAMYPLECFACMRLKTPLSLAAPHVRASTGKSVMEAMVWCVLVEGFWLCGFGRIDPHCAFTMVNWPWWIHHGEFILPTRDHHATPFSL
jgi:hypothetical protein